MVKFLHTADWQLGQTLKSIGPEKAEELRKARLESIRNLLRLASEEDVDFVLSAGDNFESNQVSNDLVRQTARILNGYSTIPIYIIPGNHDPLMEDHPFSRLASDRFGDHIHILTKEEPIKVPRVDATIYPGICRQKRSSNNPIDWIPGRHARDGVRVGLAHGSWQVMKDLPKDDYPIDENSSKENQLDYLALGHWHSTFSSPGEEPKRTFYSGTPEPTSFGERDSGNVLIVEIDGPKNPPQILKKNVSEYDWIEKKVTVSDEASIDSIRDDFLSTDLDTGKTLLNLVVSGTISLEVNELYEDLLKELKEKFYYVGDDKTALSFVPSDEEIQELSTGKGWLKWAVERLKNLVSEDEGYVPDDWPFDQPPTEEEAERALGLIYAKVKEKGE